MQLVINSYHTLIPAASARVAVVSLTTLIALGHETAMFMSHDHCFTGVGNLMTIVTVTIHHRGERC